MVERLRCRTDAVVAAIAMTSGVARETDDDLAQYAPVFRALYHPERAEESRYKTTVHSLVDTSCRLAVIVMTDPVVHAVRHLASAVWCCVRRHHHSICLYACFLFLYRIFKLLLLLLLDHRS